MMPMLNKKLATAFLFSSTCAFAQSTDCQVLQRMYDSHQYQQVAQSVVRDEQVITDGCVFNIGGLAVFKMPTSNNPDAVATGLRFFARGSQLNYPPSSYNFLKYSYLKSSADLGQILNGLSNLVQSGRADEYRRVSILSLELGNKIIADCYSSVSPDCRGRKVTDIQKNQFESDTQKTLATINEDYRDRRKDTIRSYEITSAILAGIGIAVLAAPSVNNLVAPKPAAAPPPMPNPATHPWLYGPMPQ